MHSWRSPTHLQQHLPRGSVLTKALAAVQEGKDSSWPSDRRGRCQGHNRDTHNGSSLCWSQCPLLWSPPNRNCSHLFEEKNPFGSWLIKKTTSVPAKYPEVLALKHGGGSMGYQTALKYSEVSSELEGMKQNWLGSLTCCLPLAKGQVAVGPSGVAPAKAGSLAAPRPAQITPEQRTKTPGCPGVSAAISLGFCSHPPSLAADCWKISQQVLSVPLAAF